MSYTVLARRYRPETFDDVVGQEPVARTLKNALSVDRVAHAYLFTGTRGVGKTTMARILAKALNCLNADGPTTTPCLKCESCRGIAEGDDLDVIEIDAASNTGVEHIRELRQNAIYRPARARFKIYIIDEVHMLSTSAFNALLKTLEEPPEHVKFILATTEPNKVLATILSRCQRFDFRNIQPDDIIGQLQHILAGEKVEAEEALVRRVARLANGSMRDALSLLDQLLSMSDGKVTLDLLNDLLGAPRSERIITLADAVTAGDLGRALTEIDAALSEGLALEQLADALQEHFRDLLVLRNCGADTELVDLPDAEIRGRAVEQSRQFDDAALVYYVSVMEELRRALKSTGAGRALFEAAVVRLAAADRFSDTRALLEQLQQIAAGQPAAAATPPPPARQTASSTAPPRPPRQNSAPAPASSPQPAAQSGKPAAFQAPDNIDETYLCEQWPAIVAEIGRRGKRHLEATLRNGTVAAWEDGALTIGHGPTAGALKMLSSRADAVKEAEQLLGNVLGTTVKLRFQETATAPQPSGHVPGAKPSRQEIDAAMNDPGVREVQSLFGGRVRSVERNG